MSKALASHLLIPTLLVVLLLISSAAVSGVSDSGNFPRCNCDDDGSLWSIESILECQRVSDFLIAVAYFSIPIELLYFVSCSNVPFKWVLFQFIAFIVLCGMTHLLNGWTYHAHPFQLMLALTVFKILTALVSCATAITLITLIPLLLKVKVREFMLKKKTWDLGREVGMIMKQKETGLHVRMLTHEIRKSLDRHTILYTTLFELSESLGLHYCAVWMPNEEKTEMVLTHELKGRSYSNVYNFSIPIGDPDVARIKGSEVVNVLGPGSALVLARSAEIGDPAGPAAAIRMPMLRVRNFKGGTPERVQACYAVLVLVLPRGEARAWGAQEVEIVAVVADQVAVALSHAAVLEESQRMREKLAEQNRALQAARRDALLASQARNSFQKAMSDGMRRPMHSVLGLLSMLRDEEGLGPAQLGLVEAILRTGNVLSTLVGDVTDSGRSPSSSSSGRLGLEARSFRLRAMVREAACLARCLCLQRGLGFGAEVDKSLPDHVVGDERRVFQVILHMIGSLLKEGGGGDVVFRVFPESGSSQGRNDQRWQAWRQNTASDGDVYVRFEIRMGEAAAAEGSTFGARRHGNGDGVEEGRSFSVCKKLVQMMQGNIWVAPGPHGSAQSMGLVLRFQLRPSIAVAISEPGGSSSDHHHHRHHSNSLFRGLQVVVADDDDINRAVTRRLLEKLGCSVTPLSSGFECLAAISPAGSTAQIVLVDLHMPELDGYEVAARIRKFRSRSWPLIVALASSDDDDAWERCVQIGINGVIRKPVLLQGIANELRRVLLQANKVV